MSKSISIFFIALAVLHGELKALNAFQVSSGPRRLPLSKSFPLHRSCGSVIRQSSNANMKAPKQTISPSVMVLSARRQQPAKGGEMGSRISNKRRQQLGIPDSEREYDLDVALETNTDPLITKIIAGSFILVVIALLVVGVIIPSTTDFGEGVCSPIQNGGRC
mmetsp:Transcript_20119/g.25407  ORF Transcript_20119/g.25407 Transcript_20119/m.25407 type:complete len:163 (+) Transcript_20119:61-549(+)